MSDPIEENRIYEPTPGRHARARAAGQIAVSHELTAAAASLGLCLAVVVCAKALVGGLLLLMRESLAACARDTDPWAALRGALGTLCSVLVFPVVAMLAGALLVGVAQTRGVWSWAWAGRRRGGRGLGFWAGRDLSVAGTILAKVILMLAAAALCVGWAWPGGRPAVVAAMLDLMLAVASRVGLGLAVASLALGLADYLWHWQRQRRALRMTRHEARREHREDEGDPVLKAERHEAHLEWLEAAVREDGARDVGVVEGGEGPLARPRSGDSTHAG